MNEYLPNYTGPYISDGKFQTSVEFGTTKPKDELDSLSRLHDSAYAKFSDYGHRAAADAIYNGEATKLKGLFPEIAKNVVLYGNQVGRSASELIKGASYGPLGFLYGAVNNMYNLNDYMLNNSKYKKEVLDYYKNDPVVFPRVTGTTIGVQFNTPKRGVEVPILQDDPFSHIAKGATTFVKSDDPQSRFDAVTYNPEIYQSGYSGNNSKSNFGHFYLNEFKFKRRRRNKRKIYTC